MRFVELTPTPSPTAGECLVRVEHRGRAIEVSLKGPAIARLPEVLAMLHFEEDAP
jgi:hypothetical protein